MDKLVVLGLTCWAD